MIKPPMRVMTSPSLRATCAVLMGALFAATPARAQSFRLNEFATGMTDTLQSAIDLLPQSITNIRLGVGPSISPHYEGDNKYKVNVIPAVSLRWRDLVEVNNNEVRIIAFNKLFNADGGNVAGGNLRFGPTVSVDFGRDEDRSPDLRGLGDVDTSLEVGAFVAYTEGHMRLRARARHDIIDGHGGGTLRLDAAYTVFQAAPVALGVNVSSTWATGNYMRSYFGVSPPQSAASGLPAFAPGSGFKDVGAEVNANYIFASQWAVVANAGYKRLIGDAAGSPLVRQRGSANQFTLQTFLVYSF
ncbi:MAG: MipA/OmpV family protein [Proteobacteria bacterium]|nr:MipA/OmpV family protein [Pseudomonadota bacterium]